ncbi:lipase family protein [Actinomadura alba]|uniref:Lipase family protein n=1 Tax=Actinomadura alba TaxID=406431 RepID=A0ABR7LVX3_9ACTN|nr:lipase family protein [Actinomadura alba]MBC6468900.1 lipase family protein [Actinomadura alba]
MAETKRSRESGRTVSGRPGLKDTVEFQWEERLQSVLANGGMRIHDVKAPAYEYLRPYDDAPESRGFPVYPNLVDHLLTVKEHPDPIIEHVLATCAGYAYSDAETLSTIMARMGLKDNRCRMIQAIAEPMFICSTSFLIQSADGRVAILCYRGTEPANFINWLTAWDVEPERMGYQLGDPCAGVHAGFYRNVRATRYEVMQALRRALKGESLRGTLNGERDHEPGRLEALYITGHSLGGAMAALMAVMMQHERKYEELADLLNAGAVYTFGQPMIGDPSFAAACEKNSFLRDKVIRYTYDNDVVPHLPPRTSGPYKHFGRERRYQISHLKQNALGWLGRLGCAHRPRQGDWHDKQHPTSQMPSALGLMLGISAFAARRSQILRSLPVVYSYEDHLPHHYISALTPYGALNEFGD